MEDDEPRAESPAGLPGWMATFADLMTLLMCFFVLLLATSGTTSQKYQRIAGSMASAFGVQAQIEAIAIPKGTSIIAEELASATPEPTPMNEVRQKTTDNERDSLDVQAQDTCSPESGRKGDVSKKEIFEKIQGLVNETEKEAVKIAAALSKEVEEGIIEVETSGRKITVRIKEHGTFPSGSADLTPNFRPVLKIIRQALADTEGSFVVERHTDNVPIATSQFRSNWALSAARAVTVAYALFDESRLTEERFAVAGHADPRSSFPTTPSLERRATIVLKF